MKPKLYPTFCIHGALQSMHFIKGRFITFVANIDSVPASESVVLVR